MRCARLALVAVSVILSAPPAPAQVPQVAERVEVARVVVDLHVFDAAGRPITDLTAGDIRLWVDGTPVRVESLRWTTTAVIDRGTAPPASARDPAAAVGERVLPSGRLIVLFVQKDLEPSRLEGTVDLLRRAQGFVDGLRPEDWIAVLSFEHHLDLRLDFTRDRAAIRGMLARHLLLASGAPATENHDGPTILPRFDAAAARQAASMEQALLVTAQALDGVPGAKSLVILGHGFGRILIGDLRSAAVGLDDEYREAARRLTRGRVTAYALDVTQAESHTLAAGLERVAADTGGFYLQTHAFPGLALSRLGEALAGRYELSFERPALPEGEHRIRIELVGRRGRVLARRTYGG
jgi:VWFA-related protein